MSFQTGLSENGIIHISMIKNWVSHIVFLRKNGAYRLSGSAEKGGYLARTFVLCHIRSYRPRQWLSGRVLDLRSRVRASPASLRCVLEQDSFILAYYWFNQGRPVPK